MVFLQLRQKLMNMLQRVKILICIEVIVFMIDIMAIHQLHPIHVLLPFKTGPFYCMVLYPGEMGTAGGLVIDTNARVLNKEGKAIPGLYACGNCSTALLPTYPGPGSTLGPAMTFGYLAAKDITGSNF
jgi:succinate dehydrogenase/fumarate reductase flavoprotein subunit